MKTQYRLCNKEDEKNLSVLGSRDDSSCGIISLEEGQDEVHIIDYLFNLVTNTGLRNYSPLTRNNEFFSQQHR